MKVPRGYNLTEEKRIFNQNGFISIELSKNVFFTFQTNPLRRSVSYVISEKKVKIDNILDKYYR